jgi:translation initiation factor 2 alpha subunit (eIF-2alpha)
MKTLIMFYFCIDRSEIFPWNDENLNAWANNQRKREQFSKIIREYKRSINKHEQDLNSLDKEELCELIRRLKDRLYDDPLSTFDSNEENINDILIKVNNQTELLNKIIELLSKPIDFKTIIKLSMAFLFVWTVKTHIIDAYLKQQ